MPSLAQLKSVVASYFGKTTSDLTVNGVDLFLDAANTVRAEAEQGHNFEDARVLGTLTIDPQNGASLSDVVFTPSSSVFGGIREVTAILVTSTVTGYDYPVPYMRRDVALEFDRQANDLNPFWSWDYRYPSDAVFMRLRPGSGIVQVANNLFLFPNSLILEDATLPVKIQGYGYLNDYDASTLTNGAYTDWFVKNGYNFLKWGIVCELNYVFERFVSRQEGVLLPPEQKKSAAWNDLVVWDTYRIDPNATTYS